MSQRLNDYFASEATEYLEQLERLLALPGIPDSDLLLRLSTGVRGSAKMAGADTVASVAERLEDAVRSITSSNISWSEEFRDLSRRTVTDLKVLVRALNRWGAEEERRVRDAIGRWEELDGENEAEDSEIVSISTLFYDDAGPHLLEEEHAGEQAEPAEEGEIVSIDTLLLRGQAAVREALALRAELERAIAGEDAGVRPVREILEELFELLELGLSREPPEV
jgi:chemotaxis protein histidine kinase CheA